MQRAASAKIKVEADEKLHHRVRRNGICMMMGVRQESSYTVPEVRPARNGTSFGSDEQPSIKETDGGHQGLDENVLTDNGSRKISSGLEEICERTTTAVQNGGTELEDNPNFKKNELNGDGEVIGRCCVINTANTTQLPDNPVNQVEHMKYSSEAFTYMMSRNSREFRELMARLEKVTARNSSRYSALVAVHERLLDYFPIAEML